MAALTLAASSAWRLSSSPSLPLPEEAEEDTPPVMTLDEFGLDVVTRVKQLFDTLLPTLDTARYPNVSFRLSLLHLFSPGLCMTLIGFVGCFAVVFR